MEPKPLWNGYWRSFLQFLNAAPMLFTPDGTRTWEAPPEYSTNSPFAIKNPLEATRFLPLLFTIARAKKTTPANNIFFHIFFIFFTPFFLSVNNSTTDRLKRLQKMKIYSEISPKYSLSSSCKISSFFFPVEFSGDFSSLFSSCFSWVNACIA